MAELLVVGSVAYDDIQTPRGRRRRSLGGSAVYASVASSYWTSVHLVGVAGKDFRMKDFARLKKRGIRLEGFQIREGKTFFWRGRYEGDMSVAQTLETELNVFADFQPTLPASAKRASFVFLANIHPELQATVIRQLHHPRWIALDTMNLWIETQRRALKKILQKVDLLLLNDQETKMLGERSSLLEAAERIQKMGPPNIIVKKGEHGAVLLSRKSCFPLPALPLRDVVDPTGAGDSFAGGLMGYLARKNQTNIPTLQQGMMIGTLTASLTVQDFSIDALERRFLHEWPKRLRMFRKLVSFPPPTEHPRSWGEI